MFKMVKSRSTRTLTWANVFRVGRFCYPEISIANGREWEKGFMSQIMILVLKWLAPVGPFIALFNFVFMVNSRDSFRSGRDISMKEVGDVLCILIARKCNLDISCLAFLCLRGCVMLAAVRLYTIVYLHIDNCGRLSFRGNRIRFLISPQLCGSCLQSVLSIFGYTVKRTSKNDSLSVHVMYIGSFMLQHNCTSFTQWQEETLLDRVLGGHCGNGRTWRPHYRINSVIYWRLKYLRIAKDNPILDRILVIVVYGPSKSQYLPIKAIPQPKRRPLLHKSQPK